MISLDMHQWNLVCLTGSSLGSVTTMASRDIKQQSVKSGGKNSMLQPMHTLLINHTKLEKIVKREIKRPVSIDIKYHQLFI